MRKTPIQRARPFASAAAPWTILLAATAVLPSSAAEQPAGDNANTSREARSTQHPPSVFATLNATADAYAARGEHAQALIRYQQALGIGERTLPPDHPLIADGLEKVANMYSALQQPAQALPLIQRILAIREHESPPNPIAIAITLSKLAGTHFSLFQYEQALTWQRRSVTMQESALPPDAPERIAGLARLAYVHAHLGQHEHALVLRERVLRLREASLPTDAPSLISALDDVATSQTDLGNYPEALRLSQRVLALREDAPPKDDFAIALALNNLAVVHANLSEYAQALSLLQRAAALASQAGPAGHPDRALLMNNLAWAYATLGRHEHALDMAERMLAARTQSLPADHPDIARSLSTLAGLYQRVDDFNAALPLDERVLAMREKVLPANHPDIAAALFGLAMSHSGLGRHEQSIPLLQRSLAIRQQIFPADHPGIAQSLAALGSQYVRLHAYDDAAPVLERALTIALSNPNAAHERWTSCYWLGQLYALTHRPDLAIVFQKEAVRTIQSMRGGLASLDRSLQTGFLAHYQFVYSELADQLIAANRIDEAQQVLQMLKEQELYESVRAAASDPRITQLELTGLERRQFAAYYELTARQGALATERMALERKALADHITVDEQQRLLAVRKDLDSLSAAMVTFLTELGKQSVPFAEREGRTEPPPALAERHLQSVLRAANGTVAVQYVLTDTRLSILLSMADAPVLARQVEIHGATLRRQIMTVLDRLRTPASDTALLNGNLHELHALLIAPIESDLRATRAKTLLVVPSGVLRYVPFAALMTGDRYLVQDYAISLFNEAVKKRFTAATRTQWRPVAMGLTRPVQEEDLPALAAVRDEVRTVAVSSGLSGRSYLDEEFTRETLNSALNRNFNVMHLATHFRFVPGRPDASRLFLGDLTTLTLADIARDNLRFDRFALVALSACESGVGGGLDADGRELESLGALVQNQGAHAVVATLWKVSDGSTAELMKSFYGYRSIRKLSKAQALRAAQLSLIAGRRVAGETRTHPYYWAPFVLMGDWR